MKISVVLAIALFTITGFFFFFSPVLESSVSKKISAKATKGKELYEVNCKSCHGKKGKKHGIRNEKKKEFVRETLKGKEGMPSFKGKLKRRDIKKIRFYLKYPKKAS